MGVDAIGALFFGVVVGWVTYRCLRRTKKESTIADISSVIAAVGGGAVTGLFKEDAFGMYCIGLAIGFFAYFILGFTEKDPATGKRKSVWDSGLMGP